jgi:hypothetical protein
MVAAMEYLIQTQAKWYPHCVFYTTLSVYDPKDMDLVDLEEVEWRPPQRQPEDFGCAVNAAEREYATERHDKIAQEMWAQYVAYNTT